MSINCKIKLVKKVMLRLVKLTKESLKIENRVTSDNGLIVWFEYLKNNIYTASNSLSFCS